MSNYPNFLLVVPNKIALLIQAIWLVENGYFEQVEHKTIFFRAIIYAEQIYFIIMLMILYLWQEYLVIDINILKNGNVIREFLILHLVFSKKMHR